MLYLRTPLPPTSRGLKIAFQIFRQDGKFCNFFSHLTKRAFFKVQRNKSMAFSVLSPVSFDWVISSRYKVVKLFSFYYKLRYKCHVQAPPGLYEFSTKSSHYTSNFRIRYALAYTSYLYRQEYLNYI